MFDKMNEVYTKMYEDLDKNLKLKDFYTELNKYNTVEDRENFKLKTFAVDKTLEKDYNDFEQKHKEAYKTLRIENEANTVKSFVKNQIGEGVLNDRQYNRQRNSVFRANPKSIYSSSFQKQGDIKLFDLDTRGNNGKSGKGIRRESREAARTLKQADKTAREYVRQWYANIEKDIIIKII